MSTKQSGDLNEDKFFQEIKVLYERVATLQKHTSSASKDRQEWLPVALEELNTTFEELQVAEEELRSQNEALESAHQTLEAERQRYQELFEFAPDGYLVTDKYGKIQEANRAAARLLNLSQQFLVGKLLTSFIVQEARPVLRAALTRLDQGLQEQEWVLPLQPRWSSYRSSTSKSALAEDLGGQTFDANLKIVAVRDPTGSLVALRCLVRDITERKRMIEAVIQARVAESTNQALEREIAERKRVEAEREELLVQLDHKQRLLEAVLQQMPAGVTIAEAPSGQILLTNEESARILGHSFLPTDVSKAHPKTGAFHPDGRPYTAAEYPQRRSRLTGEVVKGEEMHYIRSDGRSAVLSVNTAPVRDPQGCIVATVGTFYDITAGKQAEAERTQLLLSEQAARRSAEAANRMKDEFLSVLSHEIRTPLNAILGWAQLLRTRNLDKATTARALETIERSARSQARLIEDLLDTSQIIRGKLVLDVRAIELVPVIEAAIETVRPAAEAKAIQLVALLDPLASSVMADENRLQQVVWNLLSNAIKFTPSGGRVEVSLEQFDAQTQIRVRDTGSGIAPEFLPYIFDRFRQADSTVSRTHKGLGLGLAIVRQLVKLHGGTVQAESVGQGQGATFTVALPRRASSIPAQDSTEAIDLSHSVVPEEDLPDDSSVSLAGLEVMVVDDEADARELLKMTLEQSGATVTAIASAAEALKAIAGSPCPENSQAESPLEAGSASTSAALARRPDILLSDIGMPEEDGYRLIRKLRALKPEQGGQIPAVALTAYASKEDRSQALSAGFQMHVPKPVSPTELIAIVAKLTKAEKT